MVGVLIFTLSPDRAAEQPVYITVAGAKASAERYARAQYEGYVEWDDADIDGEVMGYSDDGSYTITPLLLTE